MKRPSKLDWLVYRLFRWWWNPILRENPALVDGMIVEMGNHREYRALTRAVRAGILTKANPPEKPDS